MPQWQPQCAEKRWSGRRRRSTPMPRSSCSTPTASSASGCCASLAGRNVYPVDSNRLGPGAANKEAWPAHLTGKPALLINVSRSRTPAAYLDLLWNSIVVLNEAYPEPPRSVLDKFAARACRFYHLAGAAGKAYPDFPWPYTDAVPCCAARIGHDTELVLRKLT